MFNVVPSSPSNKTADKEKLIFQETNEYQKALKNTILS